MAMTSPVTERPIRTLLIANRGEIAVRIAEVCRELGIRSVAIYSEPDREMPHVRAADVAIPIGGRTPTESYLDAAKVLAAAVRSGADAVHPGYGFLSENPDFAQAVSEAGLVWVGPTPESMRAMALKVQARRIAESAGVPIVPGAELDGHVSDSALLAAGESVGFPLLVKASAGGGGRGMRIVSTAGELVEAVESAQREAGSAFGDSTVFLERYLTGARHIEVQVFGDQQGNVLHVGERECSVQRRHQKVIEESPSPGVTEAVRGHMLEAAVSLAKSIGYVGAGTVEFVVIGEGGSQDFYFLEMNTRLQVEHPVTELTYDVPLIEWQLRVAAGEALLVEQAELQPDGYSLEARLYAEDPSQGHAPGSGRVTRMEIPEVRVDAGVESGSEISTYYDPMIAKVIWSAPTRDAAALGLARALRAAVLHGPVTNRDMLVAVLESDDFLAGHTTTAFLDEHPELLDPQVPAARRALHLCAVVIAAAHEARELVADEPAASTAFAPSGWRNVRAVPEARTFAVGDEQVTVAYERLRDGVWRVGTTSSPVELIGAAEIEWLEVPVRASVARDAQGDVVVDLESGERIFARVIRSDEGLITVHDGLWNSRLHDVPCFAGEAADDVADGSATPVPGTITVVAVAVGDHVTAGQTLVVLEAMKMEHRIVAAIDGVVTAVRVEVGQAVDAHEVVVTVEGET